MIIMGFKSTKLSIVCFILILNEIRSESNFFEDLGVESIFLEEHCDYFPPTRWIYKRPGWKSDVEQGFQRAHFEYADGAQGMELSHVLPWNYIYAKFETLFLNAWNCEMVNPTDTPNDACYEGINTFIDKLFTPDYEAYVHVVQRPPPEPRNWPLDPDPMRHHLTDNDNDNEICYLMRGNLMQLNQQYYQQASRLIHNIDYRTEILEEPDQVIDQKYTSCMAAKEILAIANSAPANLRYADSRMNGGLPSLDPMGNSNNFIRCLPDMNTRSCLTQKEAEWFRDLWNFWTLAGNERLKPRVEHFYYDAPDFPNGYYVKSSSGQYLTNIQPTTTTAYTSWVRCPYQNPRCVE